MVQLLLRIVTSLHPARPVRSQLNAGQLHAARLAKSPPRGWALVEAYFVDVQAFAEQCQVRWAKTPPPQRRLVPALWLPQCSHPTRCSHSVRCPHPMMLPAAAWAQRRTRRFSAPQASTSHVLPQASLEPLAYHLWTHYQLAIPAWSVRASPSVAQGSQVAYQVLILMVSLRQAQKALQRPAETLVQRAGRAAQ